MTLPRIIARENILFLIVFFPFLLILSITICNVTPSFDGAMNFDVAGNFALNGKYASTYAGGEYFNHGIQSGAPLILPAAFFIRIFGVACWSAQLAGALYLAGLFIIIGKIGSYMFGTASAAVAVLVFIAAPRLFDVGSRGYGEIPALFFFFLAALFFLRYETSSEKAGLAKGLFVGLFLGLAILTKTVALIFLPSLLLVVLVDKLFLNRMTLRFYSGVFLGICIPLIIYEAIKLAALGLDSYIVWWSYELHDIAMQAGVKRGIPDTHDKCEKALIHLLKLTKNLGFGLIPTLIYIATPYFMAAAWMASCFSNKDKFRLSLLLLTGVGFTYMVWWLGVTPTQKAYYRRIVNGIIVHNFLYVAFFSFFLNAVRRKKFEAGSFSLFRRVASYICLSLAALALVFFLQRGFFDNFKYFTKNPKDNVIEMAGIINALPAQAKIYGQGWYGAPQIALFSNRSFHDFNKTAWLQFTGSPDNYLIVDAHHYRQKSWERIIDRSDVELKAKRGNNFLVRIKKLHQFPGFDMSRIDPKELRSFVDFRKGDYKYTRGLYGPDRGFQWSSPESVILLAKPGVETRSLLAEFRFHELTGGALEKKPEMFFYLNGEMLKSVSITRAGAYNVELELAGKRLEAINAFGMMVSDIVVKKDRRRLGFIVIRVGFR